MEGNKETVARGVSWTKFKEEFLENSTLQSIKIRKLKNFSSSSREPCR